MSLINDISEIKAVSTINVTNSLTMWQPYIDEAQETFIKPVIGKQLLTELDEYAQSSGSTEDLWDELLSKVQKPLALYALNLGADEMAISISGQGIQVAQTDTHRPAPQYQIQNIKENWMRRAHVWMDVLLAFLEENKDTFTSYVSSYNDLFIRSAEEFQQHQDIHSSRRVYIQLLPVIRSIEKKYIKPTLSDDYYDELKEAMQGSTDMSDDDQAILDLIRPALAHMTMARALQEISIDFLDWGIFETASSTFSNISNKQTANRERIAVMQQACEEDGKAELKALQEYLDTNAAEDKYATYYNSDTYIAEDEVPQTRNQFENSEDNSIMVF